MLNGRGTPQLQEYRRPHQGTLANHGLNSALFEGKRRGGTPKLNAKQNAMLVALACSDAPQGRDLWTMQLLADRLIELGVVSDISDETVRRTLKKRAQTVAETTLVHHPSNPGLHLAIRRRT